MSNIVEMIGRLATNEEIGKKAVFINRNGDIQYKIKSISIKTEAECEYFTGYLSSINNLEFVDNVYDEDSDRVRAFEEFYKDKLFVFTYWVDTRDNYKIDSADVRLKPKAMKGDTAFIAIPCFEDKNKKDYNNISLMRTCDNYEEFKQCLIDNKAIGRVYNLQIKDKSNYSDLVVWQDKEKMMAVGPIKNINHSAMDSLILQVEKDNFNEVDLYDEEDDNLEYIVQGDNPTLIHMMVERYNKIVSNFLTQPKLSKVETEDLKEEKGIVEETKEEAAVELLKKETPENGVDERAIFDFFKYQSQRVKLFYNAKDIVNFHTAVKTGSLVILSGMSGTGKSALVDVYAKALGIEENNKLIIPVRPSWNDDSDLLGYVDLIHMIYRPSDTGFIDLIRNASKPENKNKLYIVCLDEMNLARVEHYFSQFLSVLEKQANNRELILYDKQYEGRLYNSDRYPYKIEVGDNIKFIGTVNIDESTYHFSDKVLDRANVITLNVLNYSEKKNWKTEKFIPANNPVWTKEDFDKLIKSDDQNEEPNMRIRELLWKLHELLHSMNANLGVGPRILVRVESYMRNIPEAFKEFELTASEALDYQLAQRILTKIRGPEEQVKDIFENDAIYDILNSFADLSDFVKSKEILEQKKKELGVYGYCV